MIPHPIAQPGASYFKLTARPGQNVQVGTIELRNPTARAQPVALAAVDAATLGTLGSTYLPRGSRRHGATLWLRVGRSTIVVPPRGSATAPIGIRVPRRARPGDYLSGVSVEALHQLPRRPRARRGISIASVVRYAIGVEVSLPGRRHPLIRFTGAGLERQPAGLAFLLYARNRGNAILQGVHGHVRVSRAGRTVLSRPIPAGTFVAHTAIAYPVPAFGQTPSEGTRYLISAWMRYRGGIARLQQTVVFGHRAAVLQQRYRTRAATHASASWWKTALLAVALAYGLLTTILLWRRRRSREADEQGTRGRRSRKHDRRSRNRLEAEH